MQRSLLFALMLVTVLVAGCADDASEGTEDTSRGNGADGTTAGPTTVPLRFASDSLTASTSFEGSFALEDNDQYAGELHETAGQDPDNLQFHDLGPHLPTEGIFVVQIVADADPGDGDIDVWFEDQGTLLAWRCDCPFGGHNELTAYGLGDGGDVSIAVRYDEIHSEPTETGIAAEGFDYTLDVTVTAEPGLVPPGLPVAVRLAAGDRIEFRNHTQTITLFAPDDTQAAVLEPSGVGTFQVDEGDAEGEYVFIQRFDGQPMQVDLIAQEAPSAPRSLARILEYGGTTSFTETAAGSPGSVTFEAPPGTIEVGACGIGSEVEVEPEFRILDPSGEEWAGDDGGVSLGGWGNCFSNWLGSPDVAIGTWTAEFADAAGLGGQMHTWVTTYER